MKRRGEAGSGAVSRAAGSRRRPMNPAPGPLPLEGSAGTNFSLVIDGRDAPAAVRALHAAFFPAPAASAGR